MWILPTETFGTRSKHYKKFNKNYHKINGYMTKGLLVSRANKLKLHKKSITEPTETNLSAYRSFRNLYTKILRASKKLYFDVRKFPKC